MIEETKAALVSFKAIVVVNSERNYTQAELTNMIYELFDVADFQAKTEDGKVEIELKEYSVSITYK